MSSPNAIKFMGRTIEVPQPGDNPQPSPSPISPQLAPTPAPAPSLPQPEYRYASMPYREGEFNVPTVEQYVGNGFLNRFFNRPEPVDYSPGFWDNPQRIARYYLAATQTLPPGAKPPSWLDLPALGMAYTYYQARNPATPWYLWDYPTADDPVRQITGGLAKPPITSVRPDEHRYYSPEEVGSLMGPGDYQPSEQAMQDLVNGIPKETWEQLPAWQKVVIPLMPWVNRAVGTGSGALAGFGLGGPVGAAVGGVAGGALTYGAEQSPTLAKALMVLDKPAQWLEGTLGILGQAVASIQDPQKYGQLSEILGNLKAAYEAGQLTYEGLGASLGQPSGQVSSWTLGQPTPNTWTAPGGDAFSYALSQARRQLVAGAAPEDVYNQWVDQFGFAGQLRDLAGHMFLDPLNKLGEATNLVGGKMAQAAGNVPLAKAFEGSTDTLQAVKEYGRTLRQMPLEEAQQYGSLSKWVAGFRPPRTPEGGVDLAGKWNLDTFAQPAEKGVLRPLDAFTGLTPQARATEVLHQSMDGLRELIEEHATDLVRNAQGEAVLDKFGQPLRVTNPQAVVKTVDALAKLSPEQVVTLEDGSPLPKWYQSGEAQALPLVMRDLSKNVHELYDQYRIAEPQRNLLRLAAELAGEEPHTIMARLHNGGAKEAADFWTQVIMGLERRAKAGEKQAIRLLEGWKKEGNIDGQRLKQYADNFLKEDGIPFHPDQFKAQVYHLLGEGIDQWTAKWFKVQPAHWAVRVSNVIKRAQSYALLGWNPTFFLNNTFNNLVTLGWDGLLGMNTHAGRMRFLRRLGFDPERLRSGATAMDVGEAEARIANKLMTGQAKRFTPREPGIREAGRGSDWIQYTDDFLKKGEPLMFFANQSQNIERLSSEIAMTNAILDFFDRRWKAGDGFDRLPNDLRMVLENVQPGLSTRVEKAIARGRSRAEIEAELYQRLGRRSVHDVLTPEGKALIDQLAPEALGSLDQALRGAKTDSQVRQALTDFRDRLNVGVRQQVIAHLSVVVQDAMAKAHLERTAGVLDELDQLIATRGDYWLDHFRQMEAVAKQVSEARAKGNYALANTLWDNALRQADADWNNHQNIEGAKWLGLFKGLGAEEASEPYQFALGRMLDLHDNWAQFYSLRRQLYNDYFATEFPSDELRSQAYGALVARLNEEYIASLLEEDRLQTQLDQAFAKQFGAQMGGGDPHFIAMAEANALAKRQTIATIRRKMAASMAAHRTGVLPKALVEAWGPHVIPAEVLEATLKLQGDPSYYEKIYTGFIREMIDATNGRAPVAPPPTQGPDIPVMITQAMKYQLRKMGLSDEQIANLSPAEAWQRITAAEQPGAQPVPPPVQEVVPQPVAKVGASPVVMDEQLANANRIREIAEEFGIATATEKGTPNDLIALNIIRKTYPAFSSIKDVPPELARDAFRRWKMGKEAVNPAQQAALDHAINADRAKRLEENLHTALLEAPRRLTRDAASRELYDTLPPEQADAILTIWDRLAEHWAQENGKEPADFYDMLVLTHGGTGEGVEGIGGLKQLSPKEISTIKMGKEGDEWVVSWTTEEIPGELPYGVKIEKMTEQGVDLYEVIGLNGRQLNVFDNAQAARAWAVNELPYRGFTASDVYGYFPEQVVKRRFTDRQQAAYWMDALQQGTYLYQTASLNPDQLKNYARALIRAGEEEITRALRYEDSPAQRIALIDAVHQLSPDIAERIVKADQGKLFQVAKGFTTWLDDGRKLIHVFQEGDVSTLAHETAHTWLPLLNDADRGLVESWLRDEYGIADLPEGWHHTAEGYQTAQVSGKAYNEKELFARAFERYLADGQAPTAKLAQVFQKVKAWLLDIYKTLTGSDIDVKMNRDIRALFDKWLGEEPSFSQQKGGQMDMFGGGEDLPLFSGTPQTVQESVFKPKEVNRQESIWDMRPTIEAKAIPAGSEMAGLQARNTELRGMLEADPDQRRFDIVLRNPRPEQKPLVDEYLQNVKTIRTLFDQQGEQLFQAAPNPNPRMTFAFGADPNTRYEFEFKLVDLADLITSHTETYSENPAFPQELQPRQRNRAAGQLQVQKIASTLEPDALLVDTNQLDRGPMIIGLDHIVESGNGRALALKKAYQDYPERWQAYEARLKEILPNYGLSEADLEGIQNPVLVRQRVSDVDRAAFAAEANQSATMRMSVLETALQDAGRVSDQALANLAIDEGWSIEQALRSKDNGPFVRSFVDALPETERATVLDEKGQLSLAGMGRIKSALFAHVYPGEAGQRLLQIFLESPAEEIKNLQNALYRTLPAMAKAEGAIRKGLRSAELSLTEDLSKAVDVYARLKQSTMSVGDYLAQMPLFERELTPFQESLLKYLDENGRKPKRLASLFEAYAAEVMQQPDPNQGALFGNAELGKGELLDAAAKGLGQDTDFAATEATRVGELPAQQPGEAGIAAAQAPGAELAGPNPRGSGGQPGTSAGPGAGPAGTASDAVGLPVGTTDRLAEPPLAEVMAEGYRKQIVPLIAQLEQGLTGPGAYTEGQLYNLADLDPVSQRKIKAYLGQVFSQLSDVKLGAIRHGEIRRDMALLNYTRRFGFDNLLGAVMPYQFWYTRSMLNWALRALSRPSIFANYARLSNFTANRTEQPGYPTRLKKKSGIALPFLPDWMGENVYIDPMKQIFPFAQMARPFETAADQASQEEKRAASLLQQQAADETITPAQAQEAITSRQGALWDRALAQARNEIEADILDPMDFVGMMSGFSLPIEWARQIARGTPERIGQLPMTRLVQAVTGALGVGGTRGVNLEAPFRKAVGLPELDRFEDYRVDRMLANLAAEGQITAADAERAMIDRTGPAFDLAERRVSQLGAWQYAGAPLGVDFFPEGEQGQRQLQSEYDRAITAWKSGDSQALTNFFDTYPEYEARLASFRDPEERLKRFIIAEVWDKYTALPDLYQRQVREQLGEPFTDAFLNKDTRSYDSLDLATLAAWAQMLGATNPKAAPETPAIPLKLAPEGDAAAVQAYNDARDQRFPEIGQINTLYYSLSPEQQQQFAAQYPQIEAYRRWDTQYRAEHPAILPYVVGDQNTLYGLPVESQQLVYSYRSLKDQMFPQIESLQTQYFALDNTVKRKAFRLAHPELPAYWEWRKQVAAQYPKISPYILSDQTLGSLILGGEQPQAASALTQIQMEQFTTPLVRQLLGYYYAGQPLTQGAQDELDRLWRAAGSPGDLTSWVNQEVKAYFAAPGS